MSTCKPLIAKPLKSSLEIKLIPPIFSTYAMSCVIWYRLYNLKIGNNTHWVLPLVKLQAKACNFTTKITFLHGCSSRFLNCTNGNKWRNASHMIYLHQTLGGVRLRLLKSLFFLLFTGYRKSHIAQVSTTWTKFPLLSYDFQFFLSRLRYSLDTFNLIFPAHNLVINIISMHSGLFNWMRSK